MKLRRNRSFFRRASWIAVLAMVAFILLITANALRQRSRQEQVPAFDPVRIDAAPAARRLAGALRYQTIAVDGTPGANASQFLAFHAYLQQQFPRAHAVLKLEKVGDYSLLYTWPGTSSDAAPVMLMAHQDVVPIAPGTAGDWTHPPFAGAVQDGFVWGRGALDDKGNLMAIMEAVERLATSGFKPRRTVYLAFGHDEETGGSRGAAAISQLLEQRGVRLAFVLDEGPWITFDVLKSVPAPIAVVGIAEKGMLTLSLKATAEGGHSSMPPSQSAIGRLGKALSRLEEAPLPARLDGATGALFDVLAPETTGATRVMLSNRWLFAPVLTRRLQQSPTMNALIRTTTALTVVRGGNKRNVLPESAEALANFRLLPGDTVGEVIAHVRRTIGDDSVSISVVGTAWEASPASSASTPGFRSIAHTIREIFPNTVVAPGLVIGGTDAKHMLPIADNAYRFSPFRLSSADFHRYHGTDERIGIAEYGAMISFYLRLFGALDPNTPVTPKGP